MQDFDLSIGAMIGLAAGAAMLFMVKDGITWQLAVLRGARHRGPRRPRERLHGRLPRRLQLHHHAGDGHRPDRCRVRASPARRRSTSGFPAGLPRARPQRVPRAEQPALDRARDRGRSSGCCSTAARSAATCTRSAATPRPRASRACASVPLRVVGFVIVGVAATVVGLLLTAESGSYSPNVGTSYLLPAFAAVFLGAAVFRPGEFNVPGHGRRRPLPRRHPDRPDDARPRDLHDQPRPGRHPRRPRSWSAGSGSESPT